MSEKMDSAQELFKKLEPLETKLKQEKEVKTAFGTKGSQIIKSAFILMKSQLGLLADEEEGGKVLVPKEYKKKILDASELIYVIAMERPTTPFYREVVEDYLLVMSNWNNEIGKSKKMGNYILGTRRILDCATTINQTISIMRHLLRKLKNEMNYRPPAFENARHYLQSLEEDIEKLGKENVDSSDAEPTTCEGQEGQPKN